VTLLPVLLAALAALLALLAAAASLVVRRVDAVTALELSDERVRGGEALLWLVERPVLVHRVAGAASAVAAVTLALTAPGPLPAGVLAAAAALLLAPLLVRLLAGRRPARFGLALAPLLAPPVRGVGALLAALGTDARDGAEPTDAEADADADDPGDEEETVLDADERRMIRSILELDDTAAREIMVPRPDMITVASDAAFGAVVDLALATGRSRLPVHAPGDPDRIVGVVHARDLFQRLRDGADGWADLVREPYLVPESRRADDLLRDLQAAAVHLALVVDEYGGVSGLVTIEDVLEEIVGEIVDEHDRETPAVVLLGPERWRVNGRVNVEDLGAELGVELPEGEWDSVGGLVVGLLGRIPRVGEGLEVAGLRVTVTARRGRRVVEIVAARIPDGIPPAGIGPRGAGADGPSDGGPQAHLVDGPRP
jgi:CBS domain containing-hemolysin-like protein